MKSNDSHSVRDSVVKILLIEYSTNVLERDSVTQYIHIQFVRDVVWSCKRSHIV